MFISANVHDDKLTITLSGRLDTADCQEWEDKAVKAAEESALPVLLDLEEVTFVCSMFLRTCVRLSHIAKERGVTVINESPEIRKVFKVAGMNAFLTPE